MEKLSTYLSEAELSLRRKGDAFPAVRVYADALAKLAAVIAAKPSVVLMGESNSGRTSLANRLLGRSVLPVGVLANTRRPTVMHYELATSVRGVIAGQTVDLVRVEPVADLRLECIEVGMPSDRLRSYDLVDTPGMETGWLFDASAVRGGDVPVWCTLATQAWKESERGLWMSLPVRVRRNGILFITHTDCLHDDGDARKVAARLVAEAGDCFGAIAPLGGIESASAQADRDADLMELDACIAERLSALSARRIAAGYRIAAHLMRRALASMASAQVRAVPAGGGGGASPHESDRRARWSLPVPAARRSSTVRRSLRRLAQRE